MNELKLVQSAQFRGARCDFYGRNSEVYMTIDQLAECLGYKDRSGVQKIIDRNDYLTSPEFSTWDKLSQVEGQREVLRKQRIFTEDGIYEVTMLSKTEKAKEFRGFVRQVVKALRKGELRLVGMSEYDRMLVETQDRESRIREGEFWERYAQRYDGTFRKVLDAYATRAVAGEFVLPLPRLEEKTYSAGEIGERLGVSGNQVGRLVNQHNLKTEQYGAWFNDKSRCSGKEVQSFRYYESIVPVLEQLLGQDQKIG